MSKQWVLESRDEGVAILTFNDPERRNAMTQAMGEAFRQKIEAMVDDQDLRALVITGGGSAFSSGGDLDMIADRAAEAHAGNARKSVGTFMRSFYELFLSVRRLPFPTLAAINGHAIGAGLCVALACDIRYVAEEAKVGLNFTKLGLHPGMGASWTLPRLIGPAHAAELLFTSRILAGARAAEIGLANRCLPQSEVLTSTLSVAREIADCAPIATRSLKQGLAHSLDSDLAGQLDFEAASQAVNFESEDMLEGIAAARERRPASFQGR
jgi:enoyl-CoA hydratase